MLLRLLKADAIPGIDLSELQIPPDGQKAGAIASALDAASKSLVARGFVTPLQPDNNEPLTSASPHEIMQQRWTRVSIRSEVMALVGTCMLSARSLLLQWRKADGEDRLSIHEREGLVVVITNPLPQMYTFTALENWQVALGVIENALEIAQQYTSVPPLPVAHLDLTDLLAVRDKLRAQKINEALSELHTDLPPLIGEVFIETIKQARVFAGITMIQRENSDTSKRGQRQLSIALTRNTCFVLEPQDEDSTTLQIYQVSADELREKLQVLWSTGTTSFTAQKN